MREAVIQTILHVARNFPIIRFDAAMTLAKRHFQRLWFPEPGTGGAIPSRAEHGLTKEQFDAAMPEEFWREVVDRVAAEAPDTLLLAEAFWLMEGYFVRTLGMHRVYNSAFMNMLRDEDNAKYRRRDQEHAGIRPRSPQALRQLHEQSGRTDGGRAVRRRRQIFRRLHAAGHPARACRCSATARSKGSPKNTAWNTAAPITTRHPKPWLVERHEREIFPLFHKRYLFRGRRHFLLYDLFKPDGRVDENVFAYSNGAGGERALVVYHNNIAETRGWIRTSAAFAVKTGSGDEKRWSGKDLRDGLRLPDDPAAWVVFKDQFDQASNISATAGSSASKALSSSSPRTNAMCSRTSARSGTAGTGACQAGGGIERQRRAWRIDEAAREVVLAAGPDAVQGAGQRRFFQLAVGE